MESVVVSARRRKMLRRLTSVEANSIGSPIGERMTVAKAFMTVYLGWGMRRCQRGDGGQHDGGGEGLS